MKKEEYKKFCEFTNNQLNELDINNDIDIEEKYDKVMDACFALLGICESFIEIMPYDILESIKANWEQQKKLK